MNFNSVTFQKRQSYRDNTEMEGYQEMEMWGEMSR